MQTDNKWIQTYNKHFYYRYNAYIQKLPAYEKRRKKRIGGKAFEKKQYEKIQEKRPIHN